MKKYIIALLLILSASLIFATAGSGSAVISPSTMAVSSTAKTLTITYTASENFGFGGKVILSKPVNAEYITDMSLSSTDSGFMTLDTTASISNVATDGKSITITVASFTSGNTLKFVYGDKGGGGTGLSLMTFAGAYSFPVHSSPNGAVPVSITAFPVLTVLDFTPTITPTFTKTITATPTATKTITATPSFTKTITATPTFTASRTMTSTKTFTPTNTPRRTYTITRTATNTITMTATRTITQTATKTNTKTITPTSTSDIRTATPTATSTATKTITRTWTASKTATPTATQTATKTITQTSVDTATPLNTATITQTSTLTPTFTLTPTHVPLANKPPVQIPDITDHYYSALTLTTNSVGTADNPLSIQEVNKTNTTLSDLSTNTINVHVLTSAGVVIDSFGQTYTTMQLNNLPITNTNPLYVSFTTQAIGVSPSTNSLNVGVVGLPSYILDGQSNTMIMVYAPKGITSYVNNTNYQGVSIMANTPSSAYQGVSIMASGTLISKIQDTAGHEAGVDGLGYLTTIDVVHHEEHDGHSFVAGNTLTALSAGALKYIGVYVPNGTTIHAQVKFVSADGAYYAQLFAGAFGSVGTTLTSYSISGTVSFANNVIIYENVNTTNAVAIRPPLMIGTGTTSAGGGVKNGGTASGTVDDYKILGAGSYFWKITAITASVLGSFEIPYYLQ